MSVSGFVSLLDERHENVIEDIWKELRSSFGLRLDPPIPHFSYHVAGSYDSARLKGIASSLAEAAKPFSLRTSGLGIFSGPQPVLYVAVVRDLELSRLQRWICQEIESAATAPLDYYAPERWVPHITLAQQGLDGGNLAEVVRCLACKDFAWEFEVDNLALIEPTKRGAQVSFKVALGGGRSDG